MRLTSPSLLLPLLLTACGADPGGSTDSEGDAGTSSTGASTGTAAPTGSSGEDATGTTDTTGGVSVRGDAFAFTLPGTPYGRVAEGTVRVLEAPEFTTVTDAMGRFEFAALPAGSAATFVLEHPEFPPTRTRTFTLPGAEALERVTFQVPNLELFGAIAAIVQVEIDASTCQIVSTVTRVGKSIYDPGAHGEAGATVTIDPPLPAEHGPIYFNDDVIPDKARTETSTDGGVLFVNVPPGTYELQAHKDGVTFESVVMQCEAGVLANASPPYGLQALE